MALATPEFLQTKKYPAIRLRQVFLDDIPRSGIVNKGDFAVTQRSGGANMSVDVAAGSAWVQGSLTSRQGMYHVYNDGVVNLAISPNGTSNPRIDTVIVRVYDTTDGGGAQDAGTLEVVPGVATSGATLANLSGRGAVPISSLVLAFVLVPAGASSIPTANIGGFKFPPAPAQGAIAGAPPAYAFGHPKGVVPAARMMGGAFTAINNGETIFPAMTTYLDTDQMAESDRIRVKTPGLYVFQVSANFGYAAGGWRYLRFYLNGGVVLTQGTPPVPSVGTPLVISSTPVMMSYGDVAQGAVNQGSGAGLAVDSPVLGGYWVGPPS